MKKEISDLLDELKVNEERDPSGKNPGLLKMISIHGRLLSVLSEESASSAEKNLDTAKMSLRIAWIAIGISILGAIPDFYSTFIKNGVTELNHIHEHYYAPNPLAPIDPNWPIIRGVSEDADPQNELKKAAQNKESKGAPPDTIIQPPTLPIPQPAPQ